MGLFPKTDRELVVQDIAPPAEEQMRINRFLAECGLGSRRNCEALVTGGRVRINGRPVVKLASEVGDKDIVTVDGKKVERREKQLYIMLNKPKGCVCTVSDEHGRKTVIDIVRPKYPDARLFPIGRLDYDTEGLLLLTTDGATADRITHPRNEVPKTYIARIEGEVTEAELNRIRGGVVLDGVKTKKCRAKLIAFENNESRIEVVITEGRNRQVRRMFEQINREVVFLKRVAVGDLRLGGLYRGEFRELNDREIEYIRNV